MSGATRKKFRSAQVNRQIIAIQSLAAAAAAAAAATAATTAAQPDPAVPRPALGQTKLPTPAPTPAPASKTTRVVRAAELASQPSLEAETQVDTYLAGHKARVQ